MCRYFVYLFQVFGRQIHGSTISHLYLFARFNTLDFIKYGGLNGYLSFITAADRNGRGAKTG